MTETGWLKDWTEMPGGRSPRTLWTGRLLLLSFAVAMFVATWATWPSLVIDCGREAYVPAAMVRGQRLYRDIWYPYGPLAPDINALLFRAFGVGLNTLYGTGLAVISISALALQSIALRFVPPVAALVCGLGFLAQGFEPQLFNYILPYSCAATYGVLFCLLTLLFLLRYLEHADRLNLALAGTMAAVAVVAKYELLVPCAAGIGAAVLLRKRPEGTFLAHLRGSVFALLPGVAIVAGVYGWLVHEYGLDFLIHGNWMSAPGSYFMEHYGKFWMNRTGFSWKLSDAGELLARAAVVMAFWATLAFVLTKSRRLAAALALLPIAVFAVPFGATKAGVVLRGLNQELAFPEGMFLIGGGFLIYLTARAVISGRQLPVALVVTILMGLMLALRVMLKIRPAYYAIYSSSILYIVFVTVLWRMLKGLTDRFQRSATPRSRSISVVLWFAVYGILFAEMIPAFYSGRPLPLIRTPVGEVRADQAHSIMVKELLPILDKEKLRGGRVLLLPELTGLYFIAGMQSPSRYELVLPGVVEPGKYMEAFLSELDRNPPGLIVLTNRNTSEYGVDYFGLDYDQPVMKWIESRYSVAGEVGHFERSLDAPLAALLYRPKESQKAK